MSSGNDDMIALVSTETDLMNRWLSFGWLGSVRATATHKALALQFIARNHGAMLHFLSLRICGVCTCMTILVFAQDNFGGEAVSRDVCLLLLFVLVFGSLLALICLRFKRPITCCI